MKENIIQIKSYSFSVKIVNLFKYLQREKREFILSKLTCPKIGLHNKV